MTGPFGAAAHDQEFPSLDARHFDTLARVLSAGKSRRRLLTMLSAVPVLGGLEGILSPAETEAAGRRKRRKKRHKHGKGRRRKHRKKKPCRAESVAQACSGKCGSVQNNCKQSVECGSCACDPACDVCFTCQEGPNTPGTCVVDPAQQGETCGSDGKVCQPDGSCTCIPLTQCPAGKECGSYPDGCGGFVTCPSICSNPTPICTDNVCTACSADNQCASGDICEEGQCVTGSGTYEAGANICTAPGFNAPCNGTSACFCIPTLKGETRCAQYYETGQGFLRPCTADAECADLGPGAFCPQQFDSCGGVCALPCPTA
jgi:hypothetical protein